MSVCFERIADGRELRYILAGEASCSDLVQALPWHPQDSGTSDIRWDPLIVSKLGPEVVCPRGSTRPVVPSGCFLWALGKGSGAGRLGRGRQVFARHWKHESRGSQMQRPTVSRLEAAYSIAAN